ncbi:hypothetical protein [Roseateles albus]|uniref:PD-(D/E)XK endonuclease-like domain-containing protein n=1 Tax=Roseateles albus TaxID=2987525 RepID=A0ABT5K843_9BURK|nr:hypothetical protein [Roseateles albus]MDC8770126.1 hypothetical protein [Roseateles albus]
MISEHKFSSQFTSVWRDIMPMGDRYWRSQNLFLEKFTSPFGKQGEKEIRGTINELAFMVFCSLSKEAENPKFERALELALKFADTAASYTRRFTIEAPGINIKSSNKSLEEAATLALTQLRFFRSDFLVGTSFKVRPKFHGCGMIGDCEGDVLTEHTLFEVKAGDRTFRITDLRQLLIYSALEYSAGKLSFSKIGLLNPRTGDFWVRELDVVCRAVSGRRASDVFEAIIDSLTQPLTSR